jgi:hypothetical protein
MKTAILQGVLFCLVLSSPALAISSEVPQIESATEKYLAAERDHLFNDALVVYLSYARNNPSGMLLNNIGNIYFYLGDFGMAISYYRRAIVLMPREAIIQKNLTTALSRADTASLQQERPLADALGLRWCSPLERTAFAIGAIAITLVFFSLNLWLPSGGFCWLWRVFALLTGSLLGALIWHALLIPQQAVVVKAAPLRASSEMVSAESLETTALPGEVVEVLEADAGHHWIRVKMASQATGYLPGEDLCFIE